MAGVVPVLLDCQVNWDAKSVDATASLCDEAVSERQKQGQHVLPFRYVVLPRKRNVSVRLKWKTHNSAVSAVFKKFDVVMSRVTVDYNSPVIFHSDPVVSHQMKCKHQMGGLFATNGSNHRAPNMIRPASQAVHEEEENIIVNFHHFSSCYEEGRANSLMKTKIEGTAREPATGAVFFQLVPVFTVTFNDGRPDQEVGMPYFYNGGMRVRSLYGVNEHSYFRVHFRETKKPNASDAVVTATPLDLASAVSMLQDTAAKLCKSCDSCKQGIDLVVEYLAKKQEEESLRQAKFVQLQQEFQPQGTPLPPPAQIGDAIEYEQEPIMVIKDEDADMSDLQSEDSGQYGVDEFDPAIVSQLLEIDPAELFNCGTNFTDQLLQVDPFQSPYSYASDDNSSLSQPFSGQAEEVSLDDGGVVVCVNDADSLATSVFRSCNVTDGSSAVLNQASTQSLLNAIRNLDVEAVFSAVTKTPDLVDTIGLKGLEESDSVYRDRLTKEPSSHSVSQARHIFALWMYSLTGLRCVKGDSVHTAKFTRTAAKGQYRMDELTSFLLKSRCAQTKSKSAAAKA